MKVYVVLGMEIYGTDRSTDAGVFKVFKTRKEAISHAKEIFEENKVANAKLIQRYSNASYDAATLIEEFDDNGSYCISCGRDDDFFFFNVWVEVSELN